MKTHNKARSMILVSPHTKILTLEINSSKPAASKAQSLFRRSYRDQRRDIMLFKLIKNSYPGPSHFSPKNISINDPFRVPTKIRERHKKKYTDFNFQDLVDRKIESKMLGVRCTPDPAGELRKINFGVQIPWNCFCALPKIQQLSNLSLQDSTSRYGKKS